MHPELLSLFLSSVALLLAGAAYRRSKRNSLRYLTLLAKIAILKRILMADIAAVSAAQDATDAALAALAARVAAIPPAVATAADLDTIKGRADAQTAAANAILPTS
jgi:hypothetical protein